MVVIRRNVVGFPVEAVLHNEDASSMISENTGRKIVKLFV